MFIYKNCILAFIRGRILLMALYSFTLHTALYSLLGHFYGLHYDFNAGKPLNAAKKPAMIT